MRDQMSGLANFKWSILVGFRSYKYRFEQTYNYIPNNLIIDDESRTDGSW